MLLTVPGWSGLRRFFLGWGFIIACLDPLLGGPAAAQSTIVLTRLATVPDQFVGGEILREVYARLGLSVEFVDVEAKRALALSSSGQADGEIQRIAGISRDYPTLIQISPPINYIEPAVFTTGLTFDVKGWESIKDYDVGIVRGVGSSEAGTRDMARVQRATSLTELIRMLDRDRFDLLVTDLFSGQVEVRRLNLETRVRPLLPPIERIYVYHYLHERHRDLALRVEAMLETMTANGDLARIREKLVAQELKKSGEPSG